MEVLVISKCLMLSLFLIFFNSCTSTSIKEQTSLPLAVNKDNLLAYFRILASDKFEGRKVGSEGSRRAANYLVEQLKINKVLPFKGKFNHTFAFNKINSIIQGNNIIGEIKGKRFPDKYIILTAHYDHLGKVSNRIYNGADDNASGVGALYFSWISFSKEPPFKPIRI